MRFMENWRPRTLLASWVAWWIALTLWGIGSAIPLLWRVSQEGAKGNASVSFGDGGFQATITEAGRAAWHGEISYLSLVLLVGIPPLILWALWARAQKRHAGDSDLLAAGDGPIDLGRKGRKEEKTVSHVETNDFPGPFV